MSSGDAWAPGTSLVLTRRKFVKSGARLYPRSRRRGVFWGMAVTLAVCFGLAGCSSQPAKSAKAGAPPPAVPVGVATVKQDNFNVYLTGLGSVTAFNTVSLKTRIDGQIMQVNFREG